MPTNLATVTARLAYSQLPGNHGKVLSEDAIRDAAEYLYGAKAGPDRDRLMPIMHPSTDLLKEIQDTLEEDESDLTAYGLVAAIAVRLAKAEDVPLVPADFSRK